MDRTVDRAAILQAVWEQNALRKRHGLPLLNVTDRYARDLALAQGRVIRAIRDEYPDDAARIKDLVRAEITQQKGYDFADSMAGKHVIARRTRQRFDAFLRAQCGFPDDTEVLAHPITYGDKK